MKELIHKGSVKDIYLGQSPDELLFLFSDRYSVFDWGEMPDLLTNKGISLASMGELFFSLLGAPATWQNWQHGISLTNEEEVTLRELRAHGLKHHCLGLEESEPTGLRVKRVDIHEPSFVNGKYDYKKFQSKPTNSLVPLEVIFRFGLPSGSSLLKRVGDHEYRRVLGLAKEPKAGDTFARPIIEYSTKLETTDRYLKYEEAQNLAGLSDFEFSRLHSLTSLIALRLKSLFAETGIDLWDGKLEFAFGVTRELGVREFILVDSIGPDELRLVKNGQKLSKEFLRGFYRESEWLLKMEVAKETAKQRNSKDWKTILIDEFGLSPLPLSADFLTIADAMYPSLANHLCNHFGFQKPFEDTLELDQLEDLMKKCDL